MAKGVVVIDPLNHFMDRVTKLDGGCWSWEGAKNQYGYGSARIGVLGGHKLVHVAVYELTVGAIPEGLELDHLCRNRACCIS